MQNNSTETTTLTYDSIERVFIVNDEIIEKSLKFVKHTAIGDLTTVNHGVFKNFALANLAVVRDQISMIANASNNDTVDCVIYKSSCIVAFYAALEAWSRRIAVDSSTLYIRDLEDDAWRASNSTFYKSNMSPYILAVIDAVAPGIVSILGPDETLLKFYDKLAPCNDIARNE